MNFINWMNQLDISTFLTAVITVAASVICIVVHETSHGRTALFLGDDTAQQAGRLTLNPFKHIDIAGLLMMALFHFGWAKPVPVDAGKLKHPKLGMAITALAGPLSNVILAYFALLLRSILCWLSVYDLYDLSDLLSYFISFFEDIAIISIGLAVFNFIPIPPLDGSKIFFAILPKDIWKRLMKYEQYGIFILMGLLFWGILDSPMTLIRNGILNLLARCAWFPYEILSHIVFD